MFTGPSWETTYIHVFLEGFYFNKMVVILQTSLEIGLYKILEFC